MKTARQSKIIELIEKNEIETQEELAALLIEAGFKTTQATMSRDIRELKLTKVASDNGSKTIGQTETVYYLLGKRSRF